MTQHEVKELFEAGLIDKATREQMLIMLGFFYIQNSVLIKRKLEKISTPIVMPPKGDRQ
jgi:hypothetical protein